jgi:acyl dehydratase
MSTQHSEPRVLDKPPATLPMMLRATLPAVPVLNQVPGVRRSGSQLPDLVLTRHDVPVDRSHVAAYAEVCGFPLKEALPVTYPHVLAFPLHMAIMTDRAFPFPAIGIVHLENTITQHRSISPDEFLQVTARPAALRPHAKGRLFDIEVDVHSAGELVWQSTSTLLRLGGGDREAPTADKAFEDVPPGGTRWRLPGDLGRRYASVSGDHNPIHLYGLTAKAFGFPRQIAHGMWSKARCLAALDGRLPDAVRVEVAFKKPILLPGAVALGTTRVGDGYAFSLTDPRRGAPHLLGRAVPVG